MISLNTPMGAQLARPASAMAGATAPTAFGDKLHIRLPTSLDIAQLVEAPLQQALNGLKAEQGWSYERIEPSNKRPGDVFVRWDPPSPAEPALPTATPTKAKGKTKKSITPQASQPPTPKATVADAPPASKPVSVQAQLNSWWAQVKQQYPDLTTLQAYFKKE
jgi:hypothetical protein